MVKNPKPPKPQTDTRKKQVERAWSGSFKNTRKRIKYALNKSKPQTAWALVEKVNFQFQGVPDDKLLIGMVVSRFQEKINEIIDRLNELGNKKSG